MNPNILLLIIIFMFIYYNYKKIFQKIEDNNIIKLGILDDTSIKNIANNILNLSNNKNIKLIKYNKSNDLLKDLNNNVINIGIDVENNFIDSVLGLNSFQNKMLKNINFCCGLYFNFYYFISNVFFKNNDKTIKIDSVDDLVNFYDINKRHYIIGTEDTSSLSFISMIIVLNIYKFKPINIKNKEHGKNYDSNVIFYYNDNIENLSKKLIKNEIDGLFLVRTYKDKNIKFIADYKEIIFMNMYFNNTIFDSIFSNYFIKKEIDISYFNDDDIVNSSFESRSNRVILISNKSTENDIIEDLVKIYFENNFKLINNLYSKNNLNNNHNLFEPLEMTYINKNIKIHNGAHNYFKKKGFIEQNPQKKNFENFKYYWKYDKIGLNKFKL